MNHFWLVWNEQGRAPTFKHDTPESAKSEAKRLALLSPGSQFHVMQVIGTAHHNAIQWHEYGEFLPF